MRNDDRRAEDAGSLKERVHDLMSHLQAELAELVSIPSVSEPGYPEPTHAALGQAHDMVAHLFRDAGCEDPRSWPTSR